MNKTWSNNPISTFTVVKREEFSENLMKYQYVQFLDTPFPLSIIFSKLLFIFRTKAAPAQSLVSQ